MGLLRRLIVIGACLAVAAGSASPAGAQTQQQIDQCVNKGNAFTPDLRIGGCTALIQSGRASGKVLAAVYNNRGAVYYYEKKDYDHAIADFSEATRIDPQFIMAFHNRGRAYYDKNDYDRAIADYSEVIRLDPKDASSYRDRGLVYNKKNDYGHAIADFSAVIRLNPNDADAYMNRGDAYRDNGDDARATADYNAAKRLKPKAGTTKTYASPGVAAKQAAPKSLNMAALVLAYLEATEDYKELSALYNKKTAADSNWAQSAEGRAVDAQLQNWRSDAAATVIVNTKEGRVLQFSIGGRSIIDDGIAEKDLEKSPPYRKTMADGIARNIVISRLDPKVQALLAAFRSKPEASSAAAAPQAPVSPVPVVALTRQQFDWCNGGSTNDLQISGCTAVIESGDFTGKNLAIAFHNRGAAYFNEMQYERAIEDFGEVIRLNPQDAEGFYDRADAYKSKSQYDRAILDFDEAIKLNPNFAKAFNRRGEAYQMKGLRDRAIKDFDEAIRLNPQDAHAYQNRAIVYHGMGQYDRAIKDFDQAIRINPQDPQALRNRGFVKKEKGDIVGGDADLAKAEALDLAHQRRPQ